MTLTTAHKFDNEEVYKHVDALCKLAGVDATRNTVLSVAVDAYAAAEGIPEQSALIIKHYVYSEPDEYGHRKKLGVNTVARSLFPKDAYYQPFASPKLYHEYEERLEAFKTALTESKELTPEAVAELVLKLDTLKP